MRPDSCTFCGKQTDNLLEIYPGSRVAEKRPFCGLCLETADACGICFQSEKPLDNRMVLQSLYRLAHHLLAEVRDLRQEQAVLRRELENRTKFIL